MITIHPITIAVLDVFLPLFSQSYGAPVILADEKTYFETVQPIGWYYAKEEEEIIGFSRYFPVGTASLVQLELFATSTAIEQQLLGYFLEKCLLSDTKFSVRLCCHLSKKGLIATAQDLGFQQVATYQTWYLDEVMGTKITHQVRWAQSSAEEVYRIKALATSTFGTIEEERLFSAIEAKKITILEKGGGN